MRSVGPQPRPRDGRLAPRGPTRAERPPASCGSSLGRHGVDPRLRSHGCGDGTGGGSTWRCNRGRSRVGGWCRQSWDGRGCRSDTRRRGSGRSRRLGRCRPGRKDEAGYERKQTRARQRAFNRSHEAFSRAGCEPWLGAMQSGGRWGASGWSDRPAETDGTSRVDLLPGRKPRLSSNQHYKQAQLKGECRICKSRSQGPLAHAKGANSRRAADRSPGADVSEGSRAGHCLWQSLLAPCGIG
jgi:hypothetical protein